jgi:hypothetical protein
MAYTFVSVPLGGNNCNPTTSQFAWFTTSGPLSTTTTSSLRAELTSGTALEIVADLSSLGQPLVVSGTLYLFNGNGGIVNLLPSATSECVVQQITVLYDWIGYPLVTQGVPSVITSQPTLAIASSLSSHVSQVSPTSSAPQTSGISLSPSHISNGLSSGAKAGITIGVILIVALLVALTTLFLCRRKRKKSPPPEASDFGNQLPSTEKEVASLATNLHEDSRAAKSSFLPIELDGSRRPVAEDSIRQALTGFTEAQHSTSPASIIPRSQSPDPATAPEVYVGNEVAGAPIVVDPEVARMRAELEEISAQQAWLRQLHALSTREQDLRRALKEREGAS